MHRLTNGGATRTPEVCRGNEAGAEDRQLRDPGVATGEEEEVSVDLAVQLSVIFVVEGKLC